MGGKLWKQTSICVLMVLALLIAKNSGIAVMEKGAESVMRHMSVNYTKETVRQVSDKGKAAAASAMGKAENAVSVITGKTVYGDPVDTEFEGSQVPVYAVAGGQVISTGENEEIGKYIRILHGNQAESLYGNLYEVKVGVPSNVSKGQIIGIYDKRGAKDFYFSLKEKE